MLLVGLSMSPLASAVATVGTALLCVARSGTALRRATATALPRGCERDRVAKEPLPTRVRNEIGKGEVNHWHDGSEIGAMARPLDSRRGCEKLPRHIARKMKHHKWIACRQQFNGKQCAQQRTCVLTLSGIKK